MRNISLDKVEPGQKNARTIFGDNNKVLLHAGVILKTEYIERLRLAGIDEIYIDDDISSEIQPKDVICDKTRQDAKKLAKSLMEGHAFCNSNDMMHVKAMVDKIIENLLSNEDILLNLYEIKTVDDYTFSHCVNVCIYSLIIGISLGYNMNRLKDLGVGAILHDIGKLAVPNKLLKKPAELDEKEFEEIKLHTKSGYEILKHHNGIGLLSSYIALNHHERYDGSGYPGGLKGEDIHECARIVAIADVYDALTSDRVYRQKIKPHFVVEYLTNIRASHFDAELVKHFLRYIALYPLGTAVILSTNEIALVVRINRHLPTRPVVKIIYDATGNKLENIQLIDISKNTEVSIVKTCEI